MISKMFRHGMDRILCQCSKRNRLSLARLKSNSYSSAAILGDSDNYDGHIPVMVEEVMDAINAVECRTVVDLTFGAGGHSMQIIRRNPSATIYAFDRDPVSFNKAKELQTSHNIVPFLSKFSEVERICNKNEIYDVDAVILDAGSSSMQFDNAHRGFSISSSGPLDMRMSGPSAEGLSAYDVVNYMEEDNLSRIIKRYGEEKNSRKIARAIVDTRNAFGFIQSTTQLAEVVASVTPNATDKIGRFAHPATRTFQAIRIFVNDELRELEVAIRVAHRLLRPGGVCATLTFHSLEDRLVKHHFHGQGRLDNESDLSLSEQVRRASSPKMASVNDLEKLLRCSWEPFLRRVIKATAAEVVRNPRARSANFRAAKKI